MSYISNALSNLVSQTAFFNLTVGNYIMILVACIFLYLAAAGTDCFRYAAGKYLSGYHPVSRGVIRRNGGIAALLLSAG